MEHIEVIAPQPEIFIDHSGDAQKSEGQEPKLVTRTSVSSGFAYQMRLLQLGAVEGSLGALDINPALKPLIEAMHQVLAGGTVEIHIAQQGTPEIVQDLNRRLEQMTQEANEISRTTEYSILAMT